MACIACGVDALFRFIIVDRSTSTVVTTTAPTPTQTVTLAVGQQIGSVLDLYSPLLSATSPLLGPHCTAGPVGGGPDGGLDGLHVGSVEAEAEAEAEGWVFRSLRREVWAVCTLPSRCGLGPVVDLPDVCNGLLRWLWRAGERHYEIADSLAGPHRDGLWVSKIGFSFLDFLARLDAAAAGPPARDEAAGGGLGSPTARALRLLVAERGPWQSLNGVIRDDLLSLRGDCVRVVEALELLSQACTPGPGHSTAFGAALGRASGFVPHIRHMISAVDEYVAALDSVEGGIMALRTVLDIMASGGWRSEERVDGEDRRVLFRLPPPWDISRSVGGQLGRMGAAASGACEA